MAQVKMTIFIKPTGACYEEIIEVPDRKLEGLSEGDRREVFERYWEEWAEDHTDGGPTEVVI